MPLVLDSEYDPGLGSVGARPQKSPWQDEVAIGQTLGSAFRQGNPVGSMIDVLRSSRPDLAPEEGYSALNDPQIKGTKYEQEHIGTFLGARAVGP